MSKFFIVDFFYFLSLFLLIIRVLVSSANRKKFQILEELFMSLIYSRKSIGPNILLCVTPLHFRAFALKRRCLLLQLPYGLLNKIQSNFWQFSLYHNSGVLIVIFCGQQYQMLLQSPKTHYKHSSLYQAHLQFLCIGQILLEWSICFFKSQIGVCKYKN